MPKLQFNQAVIDALPGTVPQIMQRTGACRATVYLWITRMRAEGKCHIKGWQRTVGLCRPRFAAGPGIDAPHPERMTKSEYSRRHYLKHRQRPEVEMRAVRREARENASKMAKVGDPLVAALFGTKPREVRHA